MASPLVGDHAESVAMDGRRFWKMSGSGNDFVFFDAMREAAGVLASEQQIGRLCARRTGIGADGVVFLEPHARHAFMMRYFNRDGSLAEMCGNAALCSARLATDLGIVGRGDFTFETVSGPITGRFAGDLPEIDMIPVTEQQTAFSTPLHAGEVRIGYARVGVPHLVVLVDNVETVDVIHRGTVLRHLPTLADGANANFVSRDGSGRWYIRTFERGVEEETLACGTGAVAAAALLTSWKLVDKAATLRTRSGCDLIAGIGRPPEQASPYLRGEGRVVFDGTLGQI